MTEEPASWSEENSRFFIDHARYTVPDRDTQIRLLCSLVPDPGGPFLALDLACGEGLLASSLLKRFPQCTVVGLDGSHEMIATARRQLFNYGERFQPGKFDLADRGWRQAQPVYHAVVSSLAIHHLAEADKQVLFQDAYQMLHPGGVFLIADIILPATEEARATDADAYDDAVRRQSLKLDGNLRVFERFNREKWNLFRYPDDPIDRPSTLFDQLKWLEAAGFQPIDVFWLRAGHAIFGGVKPLQVT
jgi:tRNA (cmo5U34)-methyltransferase